MGSTWKYVTVTALLLLFYLDFVVNYGTTKLTNFSPSDLNESGLIALISLSLALIALYLPKKVKSPVAVLAPLLLSGSMDFYLSLSVPFEFFFLLYAVVPFIGSGDGGFVGVGAFVAIVYAVAITSQKNLQLWIPFLLLPPLGAVYAVAKEELGSVAKIARLNLVVLTVLLLLPFPLFALTTGSYMGLLLYMTAAVLLLVGIVKQVRGDDVSWPFIVSGAATYFTPIALYFLHEVQASDYNAFGGSYDLFFVGSFALLIYLVYLLGDDNVESYVTLAATPLLLGLTVAIVVYFHLGYYFASLGPWPVVAAALPKTMRLRGLFSPYGSHYSQVKQAQQSNYVTFAISGLPPSVRATISMGNITCDGNPVIICNYVGTWRAHPVQVGNVVYYPSPDSGYARTGYVIKIDYAPVFVGQQSSQPQQAQQSNMYVRFVLYGLPPMTKAVVRIGQTKCVGDSVIDCNDYGRWVAEPVQVGNQVYYPTPDSGYASPGDTVTIYYALAPHAPLKQPSQTFISAPSRPLGKVNPTQFDEKALVNRKLGSYNIIKLLGEGGNGYVYLAEMGGRKFAIKVLKLERGDPMTYFSELSTENKNLVDLSEHPNIVKVYGVNGDVNVIEQALKGDFTAFYDDPPRIVMEFMEGGNLENYIKDDMFFYSSNWENAVKKAVRQVAEALAYVHKKGYIHSDVKPQNIFLTKKPNDPSDLLNVDFKLGDLGSAVRVGNRLTQATIEYYPPEIFTDVARPAMDVFALGITLYVLLTRRYDRPDLQAMDDAYKCYKNGDMNCVIQKVEEAKKLLASWDPQVPEPYKSLIKRMTDPDPMRRPTALDVMKMLA